MLTVFGRLIREDYLKATRQGFLRLDKKNRKMEEKRKERKKREEKIERKARRKVERERVALNEPKKRWRKMGRWKMRRWRGREGGKEEEVEKEEVEEREMRIGMAGRRRNLEGQ